MARTSKTVIGKGSGEMSDRMMRASESGRRSVEKVQDRVAGDERRALDRGSEAGRQGVAALGKQQAQKKSMEQQASQFDREMGDREARTDLEGAKAGKERGGRAAQLEQDMQRGAAQTGGGPGELDPEDQKRLQEQGKKPMEFDGKWRSTEEAKQEKATKQKTDAFKADTDRIKAETYRDQVGAQYQKARMDGKNEEQKLLAEDLARPINGDVKKFDRFQNGEASDGDWGDISKAAEESGIPDQTLYEDIKARNYTPRVQQFMRSKISREALKFIVRTGTTGDISGIDWTAPQMAQYTEQIANVNAMAKTMGPEFAEQAGIRSVADKMAFVRTQAAMMVLSGMDQYEQADPSGGMLPANPQQEQQQQGGGIDPNSLEAQDSTGTSDRVTTDAETQKAIADRKAGKWTPPADQPQQRRPMGGYGPR